jgi:hypothetical protein
MLIQSLVIYMHKLKISGQKNTILFSLFAILFLISLFEIRLAYACITGMQDVHCLEKQNRYKKDKISLTSDRILLHGKSFYGEI